MSYGVGNYEAFAGGREPFYAVYVHENTNAYHAPPTGAKFLERAVSQSVNELRHVPFDLNVSFQVTGSDGDYWSTDVQELRLPPDVQPSRAARRIKD